MDRAIAIASIPDVTVATYGDMMRVPGTSSSLVGERARGADIRVVYSSTDALTLASELSARRVVFLAVGFETTSPGIAATALAAEHEGVKNFHLLAAPKLIPPALDAVLAGGAKLDGFLCPGHVSVIIGPQSYEPVAREHGVACVVAGFEPPEVLLGLAMAAEQIAEGRAEVENAYRHAVTREGNAQARTVMNEVFEAVDADWRGLGTIPKSGLALRERFSPMDAARVFDVDVPESQEPPGCRCGEVLAGLIEPEECEMFARACTPERPVGPCMVSSEGTCAAHFKYEFTRGGRQ
jgi:hydrogenase expression/formation protein HypD